jgi:hypothetical protein
VACLAAPPPQLLALPACTFHVALDGTLSRLVCGAGRAARRAPYDYIFTDEGVALRKIAEALPPLPEAAGGAATYARAARGKSVKQGAGGGFGYDG